ncbi:MULTISPECIES: hypothetical protein [unclassified Pseudomonas]|uniref:hypothetical protein n=1 Tax=unclassified Pseudomonas TaxID=196821 RepID=UPI000C876C1E|nr:MULTISPECIES: hypothetical protein [unclassified Pseudomonas]PMU87116.1 hypothetical protein C1Y30_23475 [Pseudomonas sp. GW704-F3]PMU91446.1 hypothetical protein C1Y28_23285 [Pseudomonas sp. GW704-F5]PMV01246.1 hypothetical protein C1Y29_20245 [Pseudomonas sp. MPBD4-3]PMV25790.1 hypothetical protein C1Y27_23870 [Pseudomonas sp. GW704-F2]
MTTNQTIDGVPRELEKAMSFYFGAKEVRNFKLYLRREFKPARSKTTARTIELSLGQVERAYDTAMVSGNRDLADELRRLLKAESAPGAESQVEPAAQPQGEPVDREQKVTELSEFMSRLSGGLRHFAGQIIDAGWKKCGPQSSEPIGFRDPEFLWATISSENKAKMESCGHDLSCFSAPLYAEQPAPVAVVLPERREIGPNYPYLSDLDIEWNACLDEVTRLNPSL